MQSWTDLRVCLVELKTGWIENIREKIGGKKWIIDVFGWEERERG